MAAPAPILTTSTTREHLLGCDTHLTVSDLGVTQRRHDYPAELLATVLAKALELKDQASDRRHLDLRLIKAAHTVIPEINDLVHWPGRLQTLSTIAGDDVEPYPVSVIAFHDHLYGSRPHRRRRQLARRRHPDDRDHPAPHQ